MTAQFSVSVNYGSNSEPDESAGVAHFLEHMLAGGSMSRIEKAQKIEKMGGYIDFSTSQEDTMIVVDVLPEKLAEASSIVSDLLFDNSFEETKFSSERKIILNEISEASDEPWSRVEELLKRNLFSKHPVRRPVLGYKKTVRKLLLEEMRQEHENNYLPENMIISITGKYSQNDVNRILKNFKIKSKRQNRRYNDNCDISQIRKSISRLKKGISQTYLNLGVKTVPGSHPDTPVLDTLGIILGSGASSRLFVELREKKALAYSVGSCNESGSDYGYFHIDCAVQNKNLEKAKNLIKKEINKILQNSVKTDELNKAKDMIYGSMLRGMDNPLSFPETLAILEMNYHSGKAMQIYLDKIKELTSDDIQTAAKKYMENECWSSAVLAPK